MSLDENKSDKIYIRDLRLKCIIGIFEWERKKKQKVIINVTIYTDLSKACKSDDIKDSVDYKQIKNNIIKLVQKSKFFLIERLASEITETCLEDKRVKQVKVYVDKPNALRFARSVAVEIIRNRE